MWGGGETPFCRCVSPFSHFSSGALVQTYWEELAGSESTRHSGGKIPSNFGVKTEYAKKKKNHETMPFAATWMDIEIIVLSEVSQSEKGKHSTYTWNLKEKRIQTNLFAEQKQIHRL